MAISILKEEIDRLINYNIALTNELKNLPKGSIQMENRNNSSKKYAILRYRENDKVISKYIGAEDDPEVDELKIKLENINC